MTGDGATLWAITGHGGVQLEVMENIWAVTGHENLLAVTGHKKNPGQ